MKLTEENGRDFGRTDEAEFAHSGDVFPAAEPALPEIKERNPKNEASSTRVIGSVDLAFLRTIACGMHLVRQSFR